MLRWLLIALLRNGDGGGHGVQPADGIGQVRGGYRSADAMRVMRDVYASDRYFTFPRFHATAEYLKKPDAGGRARAASNSWKRPPTASRRLASGRCRWPGT